MTLPFDLYYERLTPAATQAAPTGWRWARRLSLVGAEDGSYELRCLADALDLTTATQADVAGLQAANAVIIGAWEQLRPPEPVTPPTPPVSLAGLL